MQIIRYQAVLSVYLAYYNDQKYRCWTEKSARKRVPQVLSIEDSYSLVLEDGN